MKTYNIKAIIAGITLVAASIPVNAAGYEPMAADRYTVSSVAVSSGAATQPARVMEDTRNGFRPFTANRYTVAPFAMANYRAETPQRKPAGYNRAGNGFNPFAANRYSR